MIHTVKKLSDVTLQDPTIPSVILGNPSRVTNQLLKAFVSTKSFAARKGIGNKGRLKDWVKYFK